MSNAPLMPMATAVWLVENTTLTFRQIADFCQLHEVEIQGIADGEVAKGIKISKKLNLFGFKNADLGQFSLANIEFLIKKKILEKNLIKPIYLS